MLIQILRTQNDQYGYNISPGETGGNQNPTKYVKQFDLDGKFIAEYKSRLSDVALEESDLLVIIIGVFMDIKYVWKTNLIQGHM